MFLFRIFLWSVLSFSLISQVPWIQAQEPIQPIEEITPKNRNLIELGKMLYFDPRLSKSGFISCNSCHNLSMGGIGQLTDFDRSQLDQEADQRAYRP